MSTTFLREYEYRNTDRQTQREKFFFFFFFSLNSIIGPPGRQSKPNNFFPLLENFCLEPLEMTSQTLEKDSRIRWQNVEHFDLDIPYTCFLN